jgi:hypothetical protein
MKTNLNIILLFTFLNCFGQKNKAENYLSEIFGGFPLKEKVDSTEIKYIKTQRFSKSSNIYFEDKVDYNICDFDNNTDLFFPDNYCIGYYFSLGTFGSTNTIQTCLSLSYNLSDIDKAKKTLKKIIKELKKITEKNNTYDVYADSGKIGRQYNFYSGKNDENPFITVNLTTKSCTGNFYDIYISYIRIE